MSQAENAKTIETIKFTYKISHGWEICTAMKAMFPLKISSQILALHWYHFAPEMLEFSD